MAATLCMSLGGFLWDLCEFPRNLENTRNVQKQAPVETASHWCFLPLGMAAVAWVLWMLPFVGFLGMLLMILAMWFAYVAIGIAIGTALIALMQSNKSVAGVAATAAILNWLLLHGIARVFSGFYV